MGARETMIFQNLRNAMLGTLGERLHYYRCCHYNTHYNTHIEVDVNKSQKIAEMEVQVYLATKFLTRV